ncbi:MAG: polyprenyl synthetase family protein [Candidatus Bathyarchaeota archaeon]|nr:polyprenyl synthetase family protein [Candidatus Bathyarchaeum sp.]
MKEATKTISIEGIESKPVVDALLSFKSGWSDLTRPALLSLACEAVGGNPKITDPVAIATSHISGAIEIIDDVIDESTVKHNHQTIVGKFGSNVTLLISTALLFTGFTELYKLQEKNVSPKMFERIVKIIKKGFFELGDATSLELSFRGRTDVTPEEYLYMVKKKAADVEMHTHIGAILGGGSEQETRILREYGRSLGMLMILRDDMEDMLDFGGELLHRVEKEALPLPLIYSLNKLEGKKDIIQILERKKRDQKDMEKIVDITYRTGGLEAFGEKMREIAERAASRVDQVKCKQELEVLIAATIPPI